MSSAIRVCLLEDYFWNNNSFTYPTTVPVEELYQIIPDTIPIFISHRTLTCVLEGDYNSAIYQGKYYRLIKLSVQDVERKIYKYQMEEDIMMNFLKNGGLVKGTIIRTNNEQLLEENLQNTKPILENPRELIFVKYAEGKKYEWKTQAKIILPKNKTFFENYFTQNTLGQLLWNLKNNEVISAFKDKRIFTISNQPIYIVSYAEGEETLSWKNIVIHKIKEAFTTLKDSKILTNLKDKVITTPDKLPGYWSSYKAISPVDASIGSSEESTLSITEINLSGLIDIVPIDLTSGKDWKIGHPIQPINPSAKEIVSNISQDFVRKLARVTYLPLLSPVGNKKLEKDAYLPIKSDYYTYLNNFEDTGYRGCNPQEIKFKNGNVGYLWYVDYLNFAFIDGSTCFPSKSPYSKRCVPPPYYENYYDEYVFSENKENSLPTNKIPGLGYLIFEILKSKDLWDGLVTYRGAKLSSIEYRSGFNQKLYDTYSEDNWRYLEDEGDFWEEDASKRGKPYWAYYKSGKTSSALPTINGTPELSFLTLDVDLLLWLYIAPCYSGSNYNYQYRYLNDWEYRNFLVNYHIRSGYIYYTPRAVTADLGLRSPTKGDILKVLNPFHRERISRWLKNREKRLERVSLSSHIALPFPINNGDIFTSDLTHKWSDFAPISVQRGYELQGETAGYGIGYSAAIIAGGVAGKVILSTAFGPLAPFMLAGSFALMGFLAHSHSTRDKTWWNHVIYNHYVLQDLFIANKSTSSFLNNRIIIFIHEGKLKFGIYREYTLPQTLSKDASQVVEKVASQDTRHTTFYHIQQLPGNEIRNMTLTSEQIHTINEEQNKLFGHGVHLNFSESEISQGPLMFKLVGTPWFAYIANDKVSLLTEDPTIFKKDPGNYSNLKMPGELSHKSIYSKMNQKCSLVVYGNEISLNTKFNLTKRDNFPIIDKVLNPPNFPSPIEYKLIEGGNRNDFISQWFGIPKKGLKSTDEINVQQISSLQMQLKHENQNYHIEKWLNDLLVQEKMRGFTRRREDANFDLAQNIFGTVGNALSLAALTSVPLASAGAKTLFQKASTMMRFDPRVNELAGAKHAMFSGKYAGSITSAAGTILSGIPGMVKHAWIKSRITEDEMHFVQENAMNMYARDIRYQQERESKIQHLNQLSSSYVKAEITDRDIFTEFTKIKDLTDIYLQILLPSQDQEVEIRHVVENFGAECVIPMDEPILITDGMAPILLQFSRLDNEGILLTNGVLSSEEREALIQVFEKGVKFVDHMHTSLSHVSYDDFLADEPKPTFDTSNLESWSRQEWDRFVHLHSEYEVNELLKRRNHYGLSEEEYEKHKGSINKNNLFQSINEIIRKRGTGITVLHEKDVEVIEREDAIKPFRDEIDGLKEKLRLCEIDKTNILQAKNTCDLINANRIKELEGKLRAGYSVLEGAKKLVEEERDKLKEEVKLIPQLKQQIQQCANKITEEECTRRIKVEKEQMEEKHNEKLTEFLKQRDQAVAQAKQSGFNSRNEEVQELKKELDKLKEAGSEENINLLKDAISSLENTIRRYRERMVEQCNENKKFLSTKYDVNLGERGDGGNNLRDLVLEILSGLSYMRLARLDRSLSSKYNLIKPIIDKLMEFEEIPIAAKWEAVRNSKGWKGYQKLLEEGGEHNGDVTAVINMVNEIKGSYETVAVAHSIKAILDELNWLVYLAKEGLKEQLKTDSDLQFMFAHVYPGESMKYYDKLFGDHSIPLTRRIYVERSSCSLSPDPNIRYVPVSNPYLKPEYSVITITPPIKEIQPAAKTFTPVVEKQPDRIAKLDERNEARLFRPKVIIKGKEIFLSDKREDITLFINPKTIPSNFDESQVEYVYPMTSIEDYKSCYQLDGKYFSWKYMSAWYGKGMGYKKVTAQLGLYFSLVKNAGKKVSDTYVEIDNIRGKLWYQVYKNPPLKREDTSLSSLNWNVGIKIYYWDSWSSSKVFTTRINLLNIFGPTFVYKAAMLLHILSINAPTYKTKVSGTRTYLWINAPSVTTREYDPSYIQSQVSTVGLRDYEFPFEFNSVASLLNYIWRHISLDLSNLESTLTYHHYNESTSKTFVNFLRGIENEIEAC